MSTKRTDLYLIIGIACNLLLVGFFVYIYFNSLPIATDLIDYNNKDITSLSIYNEKLDTALSKSNKIENLPINVDPNEIGKNNPYNQ